MRPGAISRSGGDSLRQRALTFGQRVWKRQPAGGLSAEGISPLIMAYSCCRKSSRGTCSSKAWVYGWFGCANNSLQGPDSTMRPRYITITRSARWRITPRSWLMKT